jgi:hypothetical protein
MTTLNDLMSKFASASGDVAPTTTKPAVVDGHNKLASGGEKNMKSLQDIYTAIAGHDQEKTAAAAAHAPDQRQIEQTTDDVDFAKMAEALAEKEASDQVGGGDLDFVKVAAEYDAAGRIMARGFYDEFMKLADNMSTSAPDNQNTETDSAAKTPALGDRSLPTLETNYVGTVDANTPGRQPQMNGPGPKQVYADSLETSKTINAGQGTGDDPEGAALGLGGGSPVGFATVRDLQA